MTSPAFVLIVLLGFSPAQQGSAPPAPDASPSAQPPSTSSSADAELPVSLKRIKRALAAPPAIRLLEAQGRNGRPVYRVEIEGEKVDIQALLGKDFVRGPVWYGAMTHQDFLDLVTPDDVRGFAAFSNGEGMMVAATSIALQWAVLKAIDKLKSAQSERAKDNARAEVQEALEALRKARRAAGLPEK